MLYSAAVERRLKRLPDRLYFAGLLPLLSRFPPPLGYRMIRWLGRRVARSFPEHRLLLSEKLQTYLPGEVLHETAAEQLADEHYQILVSEDLDAFFFPRWNRVNLSRFFSFDGLDYLEAQRTQGRGAVLFTGHVGGVCAALVALGVLGFPVTHLAREYPEDDSFPSAFYRYALRKVNWMEQQLGRSLIYAGAPKDPESRAATVMAAAQALRKGQLVSMAIDVPPSRAGQGVEVDFLGRRCRFPVNFVKLAHDCRVPLIPYFILRDRTRWWRQQLIVQEPIQPGRGVGESLQACVARLEGIVVARPEHWFAWDSVDHFLAK